MIFSKNVHNLGIGVSTLTNKEDINMNISKDQLYNHLKVLQNETYILKSRLQPEDTGYLHTTINTLNERILEIEKEIDDILKEKK